jgi:hypothetical protein
VTQLICLSLLEPFHETAYCVTPGLWPASEGQFATCDLLAGGSIARVTCLYLRNFISKSVLPRPFLNKKRRMTQSSCFISTTSCLHPASQRSTWPLTSFRLSKALRFTSLQQGCVSCATWPIWMSSCSSHFQWPPFPPQDATLRLHVLAQVSIDDGSPNPWGQRSPSLKGSSPEDMIHDTFQGIPPIWI